MKRLIIWSAAILTPTLLALGIAWHWQAKHSEKGTSFWIPTWVAGSSNTFYSITIHKSQINPYGTIWKIQFGDGWLTAIPLQNLEKLEGGGL